MEKIKAVLFDMDGVLLDTESLCKICWRRAAEEYNLSNIDEIFMNCVGRSRADTTRLLQNYLPDENTASSFRERAGELFDVVWHEEGLKKMPFVSECLESLKKAGFRLAVASSTWQVKVHPQLKEAGIFDYFETITTGDMVTHSKPDPEIYLKAVQSLNLSPEECVSIEDSPNGVRSSFSAGVKCIMVPDLIPADSEMKEKTWQILKNLKEVKEFLCKKD
ncbi:HAD family hydrolase [Treponema sp.]|uniref:HAD family hydrolase n=1 Tax=Treponema sp. TaxID=166 RepID=UPI00388D5591